MKMKLGEIIKVKEGWLVQFPKGRMCFKTLKTAKMWQKQILSIGGNYYEKVNI